MERPALQNKQVVLLRILGTFEKRAPGLQGPSLYIFVLHLIFLLGEGCDKIVNKAYFISWGKESEWDWNQQLIIKSLIGV